MEFILKQIRGIKNRFLIVGELLEFFWSQKLWWMIPFIIILVIFGFLFIFAHSSPLAPFIYTLF